MKKYSNFGWRVCGAIILVSSGMLACPQSAYDYGCSQYSSAGHYADFASQAGSAFPLSPTLLSYLATPNRAVQENRNSQENILSPQPVRPAILERPASPSSPVSPASCSTYIASPVARPCSVCGYTRPASPAFVVASIRRVASLPSLTR